MRADKRRASAETELDVAITALGHRGEGIARVEGNAVYVPFTLAGERVRARIAGPRGRLEAVLAASPDRIAPFCPHFGRCGGCQVQHLAPDPYREWKRGLVAEALERAGIGAQVAPVIDARGEGRRRATLHAAGGRAGFMVPRSHRIHDLDRCPILVSGLREAPAIARALAAAVGPCDVALTATPMGPDVAVRARKGSVSPKLARVAEAFGLARLALNGEVALAYRRPEVLMGRASVRLPVESFLQATEQAEAVLANLVMTAAGGAAMVADLFCGLGPFALRLAGTARVHAADSDAAALAALSAAHRATPGLKALTVERRDLFGDPLTRFELERFDCVVFDPPRAGAEAQARELAAARVEKVIAVACDPRSFARDAAILIAGGFRLEAIVPVDQFAHSRHVEVFATFTRR